MKPTMAYVCMLLLFVLLAGADAAIAAPDLDGDAIMDRVDANQFLASARMEAEMIIRDGRRERVTEMISYVRSDGETTEALVEFVNPRDRGTKYLLLDNELWMYFPDAEDLVRISGHMLREGMMGSDFSYQDALESEKLTQLYHFEREEDEELEERTVYVVKATAREGQDVAYYQRRFWVDAERFVILREEMYARDGRLLKEMVTHTVDEVEPDRWLPVELTMTDKLREGSETVYRIKEVQLDYDIPDGKISLDAMQ